MKKPTYLIFAGLMAITAQTAPAPFRFDSATSIPLEGTMEMELRTEEERVSKAVKDEIDLQLMYLQGKLNHYCSAADIAHAKITIKSMDPIGNGEMHKVTYTAKVTVAWSKKYTMPKSMKLAFPARSDEKGLQDFFNEYSPKCSQNPEDEDMDRESFFYYFRPDKKGCPILSEEGSEEVVYNTTMKLGPSSSQTSGKSPEYDKVWSDNRLVATCIFGTNIAGAKDNDDAGIKAYNGMYQSLYKRFGKPHKTNVNLAANALPGSKNPIIDMEWGLTNGGAININIMLVDKEGLVKPTEAFSAKYNERTKISDFVAYGGHSGYGDNIRALTNMGSFQPGQWQLYLINGCGSFAYVDDSLRAAHQKANPGSRPYEWFNVITNAMPSLFSKNTSCNMAIIEALLQRKKTYKQILAGFDPAQHANVTGEEDNGR